MINPKPQIHSTAKPQVPHYTRLEAPNGTPLYVLHNSNQGVVRVSFVFRAGTSYQSVPFSASAVVNTLTEGTEQLSGREIAERLDFVGSYYDANIDRDWAVVTFCSLSKFSPETMDIAEQVVLHPTFPEREISVYCHKRKEQLDVQRSKPDQLSRELFGQAIFGQTHPYGITSPSEEYDHLTPAILREFYESHYTAEGCFAVLCGDISSADTERVLAILGGLRRGGTALVREIPAPDPVEYAKWHFEGAVQSSIKVGVPLFPRSNPDFIPMQVVATAMGGYFGSRLMQNLRERNGLTYGAYAAMINLDRSGYFVMSAEVAGEATDRAIAEIMAEVERITTKPLHPKELSVVKKIIFGDVMRIFDGPFGVADVSIENIQNGTDNSYTENFLAQVESLTPKMLRDVAARNIDKNELTVTIVGD